MEDRFGMQVQEQWEAVLEGRARAALKIAAPPGEGEVKVWELWFEK